MPAPPHVLSVVGPDCVANWDGMTPDDYRAKRSRWQDAIVATIGLGEVHLARGQFEAASLLFHRAMVLAATGANRECEVLAMRSLARVRMHETRQPEARSVLEYALRAAS